MTAPVVLCGLGRVGWRVLDCLRTAGVPVVVVDTVADANDPRLFGVRLVRGDCRDEKSLREAGLTEAQGIIVATSDDLLNISCALMVRRVNPTVRIVLRMFNQNLVNRLGKSVPNISALSVSALSAPLLALTAVTGEVLAAFPVAQQRRQVAEITVAPGSAWVGKTIATIDPEQRFVLLAHTPTAHAPRLLMDVDPKAIIEPGDHLVLCGDPVNVMKAIDPTAANAEDVLFAGRIRRFGRVAYRTLAEMDMAVKVCALALFVVVFGSTLTYRYGLGLRWPDGLYRTISVIATGADMGGGEYVGWGKVFVSFLRICGTILVAAFTAIFTNFLIRAKLGNVFEIRNIPDGGHVVVVGLGNVGFRVVEELVRMGEQVVVLELKRDNTFAASCRRLGAPIIFGDATVKDTLIQARVKQARAVIVATSADLANLEIALLVAELNEKQRVVVRLGDSVLAETARTAAGVRMAISLPELAAPAFVAGLLGDRVLTMFEIGGRMLAAVELLTAADDAILSNESIRALAIDYRMAPIAVIGADGNERQIDASHRLTEGDRLLAIVTLAELDRLSRRVPAPRTWSVEVTSFPLTARESLELQVRALRGLDGPAVQQLLDSPPFILVDGRSRGQAEEMVQLLQREKVQARVWQRMSL